MCLYSVAQLVVATQLAWPSYDRIRSHLTSSQIHFVHFKRKVPMGGKVGETLKGKKRKEESE